MLLAQHLELLTYLTDMYAAAQRSKVTKKKMGSIIVGNIEGKVWQILSDGCNGVASGQEHVFEQNGKTLPTVIHAEDNAIRKIEQLVKFGTLKLVDNTGKSLYKKIVLFVMSSPCTGCASRIIDCGFITDVVYVDDYRDQRGLDLLNYEGISTNKIGADVCTDLISAADKVKANLLVSYMQEKFTTALTQLFTKEADLQFLDKPLSDIRTTHTDRVVLFNCQSLFKRFNVVPDKDMAVAIRYMLLSIAGVLAPQFEISEVNNVPPRGYDSTSNFYSMEPTICKWIDLYGFRTWADIVFRINVQDSVREILLSEDDRQIFSYEVGLVYHYIDMTKDQKEFLKLTPNISIVLIPTL